MRNNYIKNSFYDILYAISGEKKDLTEEIKELNKRISELEKMLATIITPIQDVRKVTQNYMRLIGILIDRGDLTSDMMFLELKDSISKDIVRALLERSQQNILQIEELVRSKRGTASRRIIRYKLRYLEEKILLTNSLKDPYMFLV